MCGKVQDHTKDRTSRYDMAVDCLGSGPINNIADFGRVLFMAEKNQTTGKSR